MKHSLIEYTSVKYRMSSTVIRKQQRYSGSIQERTNVRYRNWISSKKAYKNTTTLRNTNNNSSNNTNVVYRKEISRNTTANSSTAWNCRPTCYDWGAYIYIYIRIQPAIVVIVPDYLSCYCFVSILGKQADALNQAKCFSKLLSGHTSLCEDRHSAATRNSISILHTQQQLVTRKPPTHKLLNRKLLRWLT